MDKPGIVTGFSLRGVIEEFPLLLILAVVLYLDYLIWSWIRSFGVTNWQIIGTVASAAVAILGYYRVKEYLKPWCPWCEDDALTRRVKLFRSELKCHRHGMFRWLSVDFIDGPSIEVPIRLNHLP